jgi:hypothetical protein
MQDRNNFILDRYLDQLTSYVESVIDDNVETWTANTVNASSSLNEGSTDSYQHTLPSQSRSRSNAQHQSKSSESHGSLAILEQKLTPLGAQNQSKLFPSFLSEFTDDEIEIVDESIDMPHAFRMPYDWTLASRSIEKLEHDTKLSTDRRSTEAILDFRMVSDDNDLYGRIKSGLFKHLQYLLRREPHQNLEVTQKY